VRRWAPELSAVCVYLIVLVAAMILAEGRGPRWDQGAVWGYLVGLALLTFVPLALAAVSLVGERQDGTLDALVLAPVDRRKLVWGRFWNCVGPWARLIIWMLPLYLLIFLSRPVVGGGSVYRISPALCSVGSGPMMGYLLLERGSDVVLSKQMQCLAFVARPLRDAVGIFFVAGAGLYVSARVKGPGRALVVALLSVPLVLATVMSSAEWGVLYFGIRGGIDDVGGLYFFWSLVMLVVQILVTLRLVSSVARNFDRFLLGEGGEQ